MESMNDERLGRDKRVSRQSGSTPDNDL